MSVNTPTTTVLPFRVPVAPQSELKALRARDRLGAGPHRPCLDRA